MAIRPAYRLWYRGVDIADEIAPHLIACTYTDELTGKADQIDVEVQDKDGLWRGPWCPEHGDTMRLEISADRDSKPFVPCGSFEIDAPKGKIGRGGDTFSCQGVAAPISKALRTKKTRAFENQSLTQIAEKIAGEHGLRVIGTPPDVQFERITQRRKRDLEFLSKLADRFGAYFSVRDDQLIFAKREEVHDRAPVLTLDVDDPDLISADFERGAHKTYSKAKGTYYDGKQKKTIEVEIEDKKVKTGDTLRLDGRVENEGQARAMAQSKLDKKNLKKQTASLTMVGNPLLCAGQTVILGPGFGKWAGTYVVQRSRHRITRAAYTTEMELASV